MPDNLNLVPARGPNVWDKPRGSPGGRPQTGTAVGGVMMLVAGAAAVFFGGRTLYRAVKNARETMQGAGEESTSRRERNDLVDEESAQSFPASDAPSWMASHGATLDLRRQRRAAPGSSARKP
jgi:hypothetical protein